MTLNNKDREALIKYRLEQAKGAIKIVRLLIMRDFIEEIKRKIA